MSSEPTAAVSPDKGGQADAAQASQPASQSAQRQEQVQGIMAAAQFRLQSLLEEWQGEQAQALASQRQELLDEHASQLRAASSATAEAKAAAKAARMDTERVMGILHQALGLLHASREQAVSVRSLRRRSYSVSL